ncbi:unnamed protein product [Adineta ricciae]|uniref:Uncharacterized protein n=1 Tax=Adineta ricciae TaxID=249248 RepID=A0A815UKX5_ADIRI|nr:unnamed protein product [Adineta ricciae]CAF1518557.1 unnamed protein product [Adineta ricciae]
MGVGATSLIFFLLLSGLLPSTSSAGLRSWFCGTCTVCQVCPPCSPQVNVAPHCECHENLNNCNCQCLTQQNLHAYYLQWYSHLGTSYNNTYIAQLNHHVVKRRLLFSLVGLLSLNLLLMFLLGALIFFAPELLRRWARWQSVSRTQRQSRLRKQLTRLERSPTPVNSSPNEQIFSLSQHLDTNTQLMRTLTTALQSALPPLASSQSGPIVR